MPHPISIPRLRIPPPSAPIGSLSRGIQAAHKATSGMGGYNEHRKACLAALRANAAILERTHITKAQAQYCESGGNPWSVILTWVQQALREHTDRIARRTT